MVCSVQVGPVVEDLFCSISGQPILLQPVGLLIRSSCFSIGYSPTALAKLSFPDPKMVQVMSKKRQSVYSVVHYGIQCSVPYGLPNTYLRISSALPLLDVGECSAPDQPKADIFTTEACSSLRSGASVNPVFLFPPGPLLTSNPRSQR